MPKGVEHTTEPYARSPSDHFITARRCLTTARSSFRRRQTSDRRHALSVAGSGAARDVLVRVVRRARNNRYPVLRGVGRWTLGLAYMQTGDIGRAVTAYHSSSSLSSNGPARRPELRRCQERRSGHAAPHRRTLPGLVWTIRSARSLICRTSRVTDADKLILFNASLYAEDDGLLSALRSISRPRRSTRRGIVVRPTRSSRPSPAERASTSTPAGARRPSETSRRPGICSHR